MALLLKELIIDLANKIVEDNKVEFDDEMEDSAAMTVWDKLYKENTR